MIDLTAEDVVEIDLNSEVAVVEDLTVEEVLMVMKIGIVLAKEVVVAEWVEKEEIKMIELIEVVAEWVVEIEAIEIDLVRIALEVEVMWIDWTEVMEEEISAVAEEEEEWEILT